MFKHVLLPTDGSKLSETAVRRGVQFAKSINAQVTGVVIGQEDIPVRVRMMLSHRLHQGDRIREIVRRYDREEVLRDREGAARDRHPHRRGKERRGEGGGRPLRIADADAAEGRLPHPAGPGERRGLALHEAIDPDHGLLAAFDRLDDAVGGGGDEAQTPAETIRTPISPLPANRAAAPPATRTATPQERRPATRTGTTPPPARPASRSSAPADCRYVWPA